MIKLSALNVVHQMGIPFLVDGVIGNSHGDKQNVNGIKITNVAVDYSECFVRPRIWVKSHFMTSEKSAVWYELQTPSADYRRYYEPFLWIATLGIYFFAFINDPSGPGSKCCLENFRLDFRTWLDNHFQNTKQQDRDDVYHKSWLAQVDNAVDFRQYISAHNEWLWHELSGIKDLGFRNADFPIWSEICTLNAISRSYEGPDEENVVTTPYVYSIFEKMYGPYLKKVVAPQRMHAVEVPVRRQKPSEEEQHYVPSVGDVVAIAADRDGYWSNKQTSPRIPGISQWSDGYWFGWVKRIDNNEVKIIWLYSPEDTILDPETYPYPNELFFSDHCNCLDGSAVLSISDISGKVDVVFCPPDDNNLPKNQFFVRQIYRVANPAFLSLQISHLAEIIRSPQAACEGEEDSAISQHKEIKRKYIPGDTILYAPMDGNLLEPVVVTKFNDDDASVTVRRLVRQCALTPDAKPNELIFSDDFQDIPSWTVARRCYVKVFSLDSPIEAPYNRNGTGDFFYIRTDHPPLPESLHQGFDHDTPISKPLLRGLDLFCGGGLFGRGLEESGVVKMHWAVDIDGGPLHTYRANVANVNDIKLYLGNVNNYLKSAILGEYSEETGIPRPGEVDVICAGSPCQGFSLSNPLRNEENSVRKCALVCSLATAVDVYRPKYAILENVTAIAWDRKRADETVENTYATILSAMVGMGYQAKTFVCDAWSHGNAQQRSRVILALTKRGYKPLSRPPRSHSHPEEQKQNRSIGRREHRFNARELDGMCPFPPMTIREAYKHLPDIGDGHVMLPIRYPDHLVVNRYNSKIQKLMTQIPRYLPNVKAKGRENRGKRPSKSVGPLENKSCKSFTRTRLEGLCPTVQTAQDPRCIMARGVSLHPEQHRVLSLEELKIAQGFPEEEILLGSTSLRLHVVGNSVARGVSLALGIALREAYLAEED
ncbi:S-adenosyl-L-methionine-dependent methyltransferase [Pyronema omphalodes]|nr:S-adenosyl-L-methionine-dependent methyltransferase [Pyronema omphalodes]